MAFTTETFRFLEVLEENNSRDWFEANRDLYETHWKDAALDFIESIARHAGRLSPPLAAEARLNGSLRRINRDVRFSPDKSPYNARLHMIFWAGGHPNRSPAAHIVLHSKGVGYGAGQFGLDAGALSVIRDRIVDPRDGAELITALDGAAEVGCVVGEPDLVRLPAGYVAEGRRAELLRHKTIVARTFDKGAPPERLIGDGATGWAIEKIEALMPLIRWLHCD